MAVEGAFGGFGGGAALSLFSSENPFKRQAAAVASGAAAAAEGDASTQARSGKKKRKNVDDASEEDDAISSFGKKPKGKRAKATDGSIVRDESDDDQVAGRKRKKKKLEEKKQKKKNKQPEADEETDRVDFAKPVSSGDEEQAGFDSEEKLQRTIFVGNLPIEMKKKALIKEFSCFGAIETARLRSVPVGNTKMPRKGAVITGQLTDSRSSLNAYVVFKDAEFAKAALAHNMKEVGGKHVRVDMAQPPRKASVTYDNTRSIFVGNLPFDTEDEELHTLFGGEGTPELELEAVRVVRDQRTNIGKGFAFVLFKSKAGVKHALSRGALELRGRALRLHRIKNRPERDYDQRKPRLQFRGRLSPAMGAEGKQKTYEGARSGKKQRAPAKRTRVSTRDPQRKGGENAANKRPAVAARKARQKGIQVPSSKKNKNKTGRKKQAQ